jgi:hypothetical protein
MVQWFHLYEIDDDILRLVLRTFQSEFPFATIWHSLQNDIIIVGSDRSFSLDTGKMKEKFEQENISSDLSRIRIQNIPTLLSLQSMSSNGIKDYADYGVFNTEDAPRLEYNAPKAFFTNTGVNTYRVQDERLMLGNSKLEFSTYLRNHGLTSEEKLSIISLYETLFADELCTRGTGSIKRTCAPSSE